MTATIKETDQVADSLDWQRFQTVVEKAATAVTRKLYRFVEYQDVVQEGWLYYWEHRTVLDELARDDRYGIADVRQRIQQACSRYAVREMRAKTGVASDDGCRYSRGEIRSLLGLVFAGGLGGDETASTIAGYVDVKRAFTQATKADRHLLWDMYGPERKGSDREVVLSSSVRGAVRRAVGRLQRALNDPPVVTR